MTTISLKEFYEKAGQNPELGRKLEALSREYDEKLRALAAEAGYELEENVPLSDEEAAEASGGYMQIPKFMSMDRVPLDVVLTPDGNFVFNKDYDLVHGTEYCIVPEDWQRGRHIVYRRGRYKGWFSDNQPLTPVWADGKWL